jgi:hypothetical protein
VPSNRKARFVTARFAAAWLVLTARGHGRPHGP